MREVGNNNGTILVVEDDKEFAKAIRQFLKEKGYVTNLAYSAEEALLLLSQIEYDVVLSDLFLPKMSGIDLLEKVSQSERMPEFIIMTAKSTIDHAIEAVKKGAAYYLPKPFEFSQLEVIIEKTLESRKIKDKAKFINLSKVERYKFSRIIGESPQMYEVFRLMEKVSQADSIVLIQGASGTGKELVAKAIHYNSKRRENIFVAVNCATLSEELLVSELFGYVKGAFTGAVANKPGLFKIANGGTIFLDEIGEIPLQLQGKLLRVLQDGEYIPLGADRIERVDVRVIAATNKDLPKMVKEGKFREDLYYRLMVLPITLPPLKDRGDDVILLAKYFVEYYAKKMNKRIKGLTKKAIAKLRNYSWPGNVRELENMIERAVILTDTEYIDETVLVGLAPVDFYQQSDRDISTFSLLFQLDYSNAVKEFKRLYLKKRLAQNKGNIYKTAKELGMHRTTIYNILGNKESQK